MGAWRSHCRRPGPRQADWTLPVLLAICGAFALAAAGAVLAPAWFWVPLAIVAIAAVGVLAFRHIVAVCVAWLMIAGATLEMTLGDIVGPGAYQTHDRRGEGGRAWCSRCCASSATGSTPDVFNPGLAFLAMFIAGLAHGLHPDLTPTGSLRSLLGSVAPFAFAFSRLSPGWGGTMVRATAWIPLVSVAGGVVLRPCRPASGVHRQRRRAPGRARRIPRSSPAFCLAAIYACLIELYRDGRSRWLLLLAANFLILVLTGARAPLAYAVAVTGLTLGFVRSGSVSRASAASCRCCWPPACCRCWRSWPTELPTVRLFNVLSNEADQPQRPRAAVAAIRAGGRGVAMVRLGGGRRQRDHPAGQRGGADDADLGGAQRISAHVGGGRTDRPRPADRSVRAVGRAAYAGSCAAPTG